MPRGDYQVEDVEASKQPSQDNSYKMCIITIGIFLLICIILLLCTLPLQSSEPMSTDEYIADASKGTHEISEDDHEPIATTKRTTLAKYQERTKATDQLPPPMTSMYEETGSTKDYGITITPRKETTANVTKESKATTQKYNAVSSLETDYKYDNKTTTSGTEGTENIGDDENTTTSQHATSMVTPQQMSSKADVADIAEKSNTSKIPSVLQNRTEGSTALPEKAKEQKYFTTPTFVDDKHHGTTSAVENSNLTEIMESVTPPVEDKQHVPLHEYEDEFNETTSIEERNNKTEEEINHKPNKTTEDDATSNLPEYQNTDMSEEKAAGTTDGYTKHNEKEKEKISEDETEDNITISAERMNNQTTNNFEDEKAITVQTSATALHQVASKDYESSTQTNDPSNQNQKHSENISVVVESYTQKEEEMAMRNGYSKEDETERQLISPVPDVNSTEDDTTGPENSTQITSEIQNDAHKQSGEKQNSNTKNYLNMTTTLMTENKMVEAITEGALNSTNIKRSLQMSISTDTPVCVLANTTLNATRGNVCLSSKCKSQAKHLMKTMSFSVDACEDFYEFACGDIRTNKYLQPENLEQNAWDRIRSSMEKDNSVAGEKFKSFYNQCLNYDSIAKEERINQAIEILQTVGTFYNNTSWKANPSNLTELFLNMLQLHSAPLFDILLDVDSTKGMRFDFQIIPPLSHSLFQDVAETELQCREDILHAYRNKKTFLLNTVYQDYKNCTLHPGDLLQKITEALEKLSAFESLDEEENTSLVRLRQAIEFSILPCKNSLPNKREMLQKLLTKDFHNTTVKELNSQYPLVKWDILLKGLLGKEVPSDLVVQLYFKDYFDELFHNVETVEMYELHNAVLALFAHDLYFNLVETKGICNRPSYCLKVTSTLMQDVSSFLYLSSFTNDQTQNFSRELQEISKKIKTALRHIVEEEEDMFLTAGIKLDQMEIITDGGMNVFGTANYMQSLMSYIDIDDTDGYLINAVKLTKHYRKKMYQLFFKNPRNPESIWSHFVHPYNFQPVAIYPLNMVVVPYGYLGALQSYDPLMGYMRDIRLAIPLAQHIMHHVDTTGKMFNITSSKYEDIEYCLDLSYASQRSWKHPETKQIMDFKVDAPLFHNQRFTDFLALRTVLEAYKEEINSEKVLPWLDLNQEQIYFLVFVQSLCTKSDLLEDVITLFEDEYLPPTLRVADIMSNSEEFGTTYHCGVGIAMNPENKCKIFSPEEPATYMGSYEK